MDESKHGGRHGMIVSRPRRRKQKIEWVRAVYRFFPSAGRSSWKRSFNNLRMPSAHLEAKTARLCQLLAAGGQKVHATGSTLSTKDDVCAALADPAERVRLVRRDRGGVRSHLKAALPASPTS